VGLFIEDRVEEREKRGGSARGREETYKEAERKRKRWKREGKREKRARESVTDGGELGIAVAKMPRCPDAEPLA
jgi:hypothetical protein